MPVLPSAARLGRNMVPSTRVFQEALTATPNPKLEGETRMDPQFGSPPPMTPAPSPPPAAAVPGWPRPPRSLPAGRGAAWWSEGWRVFTATPALWIGITVVVILISVVLNFVPFIGGIALTLIWPILTGGILLGCHALAQGRPLEFAHLFAGFQEGRAGPLLVLGVIALVVSLAFVLVIMMFVFGAMGFSGLSGFMTGDPSVAMSSALAGMGIAALFAVPIALIGYGLFLMAWWFAPALVTLNRADALAALKSSFDASWKNLGALFVFGLIFIGLAIVASIPFGLGWLVLLPVMFGGMYASWREVFGE
jgi:uncharacterized membrane protein